MSTWADPWKEAREARAKFKRNVMETREAEDPGLQL